MLFNSGKVALESRENGRQIEWKARGKLTILNAVCTFTIPGEPGMNRTRCRERLEGAPVAGVMQAAADLVLTLYIEICPAIIKHCSALPFCC